MAATGATPISLYYSSTTTNVPTAGNLVAGELALNTADGKLFYKDSGGVVQTLATKASTSGSFTDLAYTGTLTGGTGIVNLGSGQFYKDASGNVGIGVIPKTWSQGRAIEVGNNGTALWNSSTQDNNSLICNAYYNSGFLFAGTGYASRYQQNSGVHSWQTSSASGTAGGAITFNTSMTIDASGNVGIGTTSTGGAKLYVNGYANSNTSWVVTKDGSDTIGSGPSFQLQNAAGTRSWVTQLGGSNSYDWWYFNGSAWAQQMRIDSSGRLLIGTTNSNPIVNRANGQVFSPNGSFTRRQPVSTSDWAVDANSGSIVNFYSDGGSYVYAGSISVTSNITTYGSVSDYRLKENIVPLSGALEKVSKLNPVSYSFKNNGQKSEGFIAHELQAIIPDAVTGTKDAVKIQSYEISPAIPAEIDENGKIVKEAVEAVMGEREVPDYQGVDTSFLIATLTAAIQELNAKVTALEAKVG